MGNHDRRGQDQVQKDNRQTLESHRSRLDRSESARISKDQRPGVELARHACCRIHEVTLGRTRDRRIDVRAVGNVIPGRRATSCFRTARPPMSSLTCPRSSRRCAGRDCADRGPIRSLSAFATGDVRPGATTISGWIADWINSISARPRLSTALHRFRPSVLLVSSPPGSEPAVGSVEGVSSALAAPGPGAASDHRP